MTIVQRKFEERLLPLLEARDGDAYERMQYIAHLLGFYFDADTIDNVSLGDGSQFRDMARFYLVEFFRALSERQTLILLLDDIHWADTPTLETLEFLMTIAPDLHMLILCMARPTLFERYEDWATYEQIALPPLGRQQSEALVNDILQQIEAIPSDLRELIVQRAGGNPLYVEEFIKKLIEDEVIIRADGEWSVALDTVEAIDVPSTVRGILQGRLDTLPIHERKLLQQASVVGQVFWPDAISHSSDSHGLDATLIRLEDRELALKRPESTFQYTDEYKFKHAVLHDVTYESVLLRDREVFHRQTAEWLLQRTNTRLNEYAATIAGHFARGNQPTKAITYFTLAGDNAAQLSDNENAQAFYKQAFELSAADNHQQRAELLYKRGDAFSHLGDFDAARDLFEDSLTIAQEYKLARHEAHALRGLGFVVFRQSHYEEAKKHLEASLTIAEDLGETLLAARLYVILGNLASEQGNQDEAETYHQKSLDLFQSADYKPGIAEANINSVVVPFHRGDYEQAAAYASEGLQTTREVGNKRMEAVALINLGAISAASGELEKARAHMLEALSIQREVGDMNNQIVLLNNLGALSEDLEDYDAAGDYYHQGYDISQRLGNKRGQALILLNLGSLEAQKGNIKEASASYIEALNITNVIGAVPDTLAAFVGMAEVYTKQKDFSSSVKLIGYVLSHPKADGHIQADAKAVLEDIPLTPELKAILDRGDKQSIDVLISHIKE